MNSYLAVLKKYGVFRGRARRREFWVFYLIHISIFAAFVVLSVQVSDTFGAVAGIYFWATIVPTLALQVRRLHDTGNSGWMVLLAFVPIVGTIGLIYFFAKDGQPGDNEYGPNPKAIAVGPQAQIAL